MGLPWHQHVPRRFLRGKLHVHPVRPDIVEVRCHGHVRCCVLAFERRVLVVIDLVLGDGFGNTKVPVPDLFNLTVDEAMFVIKASSLNIGNLVFDNSVLDSSKARVYRQRPDFNEGRVINQGESLDLFLTESDDIIILHHF